MLSTPFENEPTLNTCPIKLGSTAKYVEEFF